MVPTFTIFQDPPCASDGTACASSSKTLTTPLGSVRSFGRPAPNSNSMLALDADKENVDPMTGLPRTIATKSKSKKSISSKNKDNISKALAKASKASRGSASSGPAKSGKVARTSPYPDLAIPSFMAEISFGLPSSLQPPAPCLITGFGASGLSDFAEPDFDLQSDFVQQPSPTRSAPIVDVGSLWSSPLAQRVPETEGDRKARDLTELPLADLSEAFSTGAVIKKPNSLDKPLMPDALPLSISTGGPLCLAPLFQTKSRFGLQRASIADVRPDVNVF